MAGLTLEQLQQKGAKPVGLSLDQLQSKGAKPVSSPDVVGDFANSYGKGLTKTFAGAVGLNSDTGTWGMPDFLKEAGSSKSSNPLVAVGEGALRSTASILNTIFAPVSQAVSSGADIATENKSVQNFAMNTKAGNILADKGKVIDAWEKAHPEAAKNLNAALTVGLTAAGGSQLNKPVGQVAADAFRPIKSVVNEVANTVSDFSSPAKPNVNIPVIDQAKIIDNYNRGIKPSSKGKTSTQIETNNKKVVTGVNSIVQNKPNLSFIDSEGNILKGDTPKNLNELSQGITQTRESLFQKYNTKAQASGESGGKVDFLRDKTSNNSGKQTSATDELDAIINDQSLAIAKPEAVKYAKDLKDRLLHDIQTNPDGTVTRTVRGPMDVELTQNLIKHFNASLEAFYRNPTYDTASRAVIDAMLANKTRGLLDKVIESTQGPGYQSLKNEYAALKSMEADVARHVQTHAKQNFKGLLDFTDILTGSEVVRGILTLNPQAITTGLIGRGIKEFLKWKNSPDRAIQRMFDEATKGGSLPNGQSPSSPKSPTRGGVNQVVNALPETSTPVPKSKLGKTVQNYKNMSSAEKQRGSIRVDGKVIKEVLETTKQEIYNIIQYLDTGGTNNPALEASLQRMLDKYNIPTDKSVSQIKARLKQILENTKTKPVTNDTNAKIVLNKNG